MKNIAISAVILSLLTCTAFGCGGGSPADTAKAFYKAANDGNYDEAIDYLSIHLQMGFDIMNPLGMGIENAMDGVTRNGTIQKIEIKGGEEFPSGYQAMVYLTLHYTDGRQAQDVLTLQKEDGKWKIIISTLLATHM